MSNFIRSQFKPRQKPRPLNTTNLTQTIKTLTQNSYIDKTITQLLAVTEKQNKLHSPESMSLFNELSQLLISNHTSSVFTKMSNIVNDPSFNRDAILIFYIDLLGLVEEKPDSWVMPILQKLKRLITENWDNCFLVAEQKPSSSRNPSAYCWPTIEENQENSLPSRVSPFLFPTQTLVEAQPSTLEVKLSESSASANESED